MSTRLEQFREQLTTLQNELRTELKDGDEPFHPNLFTELTPDGLRIWSEDGQSIVIPDAALKPLKTVITYLTASV